MAKHPKKPLSPYDPRYKMTNDDYGKKRPFIASEAGAGKSRNDERYEIRGCGDPNCTECNSHIPYEVRRTMTNVRITPGSVVRGNSENIVNPPLPFTTIAESPLFNNIDEMREAMRDALFGQNRRVFLDADFAKANAAPRPRTPPESYQKARKAVEKYILAKDHNVSWDSVIGNDTAKDMLRDAIESQVRDKELYEFYGMTTPKGVMLWGPPGCGKTMFAKASATAMKAIHGKDVEVLAIGGSEIQSPYVAVTEGIISSLFLYAREYKAFHGHPLIMFIDECETLLPDRTGRVRRVAPWEESQVAVFLDELDGMKELGAFVILATNQPSKIDEAVLRDGRIDRKIKIERPNRKAIERIIWDGLIGIPLSGLHDELAFAGAEALHDPSYVIKEGHIILGAVNEQGEIGKTKDILHSFCLEHIVSGSMAASIPRRAKALAFQRDRAAGTRTGISQSDIIAAVREVFEENKTLEHSFAMQEFIDALPIKEMIEKENRKGNLQ